MKGSEISKFSLQARCDGFGYQLDGMYERDKIEKTDFRADGTPPPKRRNRKRGRFSKEDNFLKRISNLVCLQIVSQKTRRFYTELKRSRENMKVSCIVVSDSLWFHGRQAPLSMWFLRQEYWSGLLFPSPGGLPNLPQYIILEKYTDRKRRNKDILEKYTDR